MPAKSVNVATTQRQPRATAERWSWRLALVTLALTATADGQARGVSPDPLPNEQPAATNQAEPLDTPAAPDPAAVATLADARDLLQEGHYARAQAGYEKLAEVLEDPLPARLGAARCQMRVGAYAEALAGLSALNAESSADWQTLVARAQAAVGAYDQTIAHAQRALELDRSHVEARWLLGQTLELLGRRNEAIETYRWFDARITQQASLEPDALWLTYTAQGFLRYSVLTQKDVTRRTKHALNQMLQVAYARVDRSCWEARIAAADLLRERYNNDEHDGSVSDYDAALRINAHLPEAQIGLGYVALEGWDFEEVDRRIDLALAVNPNDAEAWHLRGLNRLLERRYEDAANVCGQALALNPNDLDALSIQAAAAACRFDEPELARLRHEVEQRNPRCARFHTTVGLALSLVRQYEACERELLTAIEYEPTDANARTELGMMYMQWGFEQKARAALEAAYAVDAFNERTTLTLELLEAIEGFAHYETEHFIIKYDDERDPQLGPLLAPFLERAYPEITGDYAYEPPLKTIIEIFPTHRHFGVRITGRPWIHTVGACTGRVIAVDSPRDSVELQGPYNLGEVLRHEFAHTVTLGATGNRIPRWFTEALSEFQERAPRSFDRWTLLAEAVRRDNLFPVATIDWRFMRPKQASDVLQAYTQSDWMAEYIVERFGFDTLVTLLQQYRAGTPQPQIFTRQLGLTEAQFDAAFATWAQAHLTRMGFDLTPVEDPAALRTLVAQDPENAALHGRLARALRDAGTPQDALKAARAALALDENNRHALEVAAEQLLAESQQTPAESERTRLEDEALPLIDRLAKVAPDSWTAARLAGAVHLRRNDYDLALEPLQRLQRLCPLDPLSWKGLAGIYLQDQQSDEAITQLTELARLELHDPNITLQLGDLYKARGDLDRARYCYDQTLLIHPFHPPLLESRGELAMRSGETQAALETYLLLTKLNPDEASYFSHAAIAAHKLGNRQHSERLAKQAVAIDPQSPARALLP